ncbi:ATP synthase F1 subunit epsilon [Bacteroidota bacterium]
MLIEIITPDKEIYSGEVELIKVPGTKGSFEVLNNHAPIISTLEKGAIKIIDKAGKESFFEINSGVIEVQNNKIIVLVEMT